MPTGTRSRWRTQQTALEVELAGAIPEIGLSQRLLAADRVAVAAALPPGSALVEFVRFDLFDWLAIPARGDVEWKPARYVAFVLRKCDGGVSMIDLGEAEPIDVEIRAFRGELLGGPPDGSRGMVMFDEPMPVAPTTAGTTLRERVFDPLRKGVEAAGHLILATDGELATLPFEVLPDADGRPLVELHRFSYLAVGRDLLRSGDRTATAADPLVIAGPDFDLGSPKATQARVVSSHLSRDFDRSSLRFPPLPGTVAEGREVGEALGVQPVLGADAVESRLRGCASPRVLHLATHGFFLSDQSEDADGAGERANRLRRSGPENPLLRSGLALSGANTWLGGGKLPESAGDGLITAEDVTGIDLLNTELVVLSACETGLGEVRSGEGVFGLRRAFQLAGARTVVMSLWKVPDEATRELMAAFYKNLLAGMPRAEALRQAQLALKARYPDPRYWGAFILQGESGPLRTAEQAATGWEVKPAPPYREKAAGRMVYDILEDYRFRPQEVVFLLGPQILIISAWLLILVRWLLGNESGTRPLEGLAMCLVGSVCFLGFYYAACRTWVLDQFRCRRWSRAGDYATTEGEVSGYELQFPNTRAKKVVAFRVGDQNFTVETEATRGGFRLSEIEWVGDHSAFLWEGSRLRIMHRDGRILRIEVLEKEPPAAMPSVSVPAAVAAPVREAGVMYVRVVAPPPWPVPEEICRAWVGMELPVLGVGSSYEVDAPRALALLAEKLRWAAQWWRDSAPQWWEAGSTFLFPAAVCEVVGDDTAAAPPPPQRTAPLAADPTFDPPEVRLPESDVPSFLDPPPPPPSRLRRMLRRAAFAVLLAVAVIDYVWGGGVKGYGVWLFNLAGTIAGIVLGRAIFRHSRREIARGAERAPIGRSAKGYSEARQALIGGLLFTTVGLLVTAFAVGSAPADGPSAAGQRYESGKGPPWGVGSALSVVGGIALGYGLRAWREQLRRR